jgi:hypothetical protein
MRIEQGLNILAKIGIAATRRVQESAAIVRGQL